MHFYVCMCVGLMVVGLDDCCLLGNEGTGCYISYSPCLMHSANAELFKGISVFKPANNTLLRLQWTNSDI